MSTPIDYTQPERRLRELLNAWMKQYFTGTAHSTPTGNRTFPAVEILFNQAVLPDNDTPQMHFVWTQPRLRRDAAGIRTITITKDDATTETYTGVCEEVHGPLDMQVMLRIKESGSGNRSDHAVANLADNFQELVRSSERAWLSERGFSKLEILSGPTPLQSAGWRARLFSLRGEVVYLAPVG